jgi:site-specific recombinase XerD
VTGALNPIPRHHVARQDDAVLPDTQRRISEALSPNTERAYRRIAADFDTWCRENDRTPLPCSPATLADYVARLCDLGRAPDTIEQAIAAISTLHRRAGQPKGTPDSQAALLVLRGHKKDRAKAGQRKKQAPPITVSVLQQLVAGTPADTLAGKRDRLVLVLGMALAGRRSELAALNIADVAPDGDGGIDILIRVSKTDQHAVGEVVNVPAGANPDTNAVRLLDDWLSALAERGVTSGRLLRAVTKLDKLYRYEKLSGAAINEIVHRAAARAGLPKASEYTAHSLRAGFATQAAVDGVPLGHWARHGRWNPTSPVPHQYVRSAEKKTHNPLKKMGL